MTPNSCRTQAWALSETLLALLASCRGQWFPPSRPPTQPNIGIVDNVDDFSGAGCYLQHTSDLDQSNNRYVFISNYKDAAIINIDSSEVRLTLLEPVQRRGGALDSWVLGRPGRERVGPGARSTYQYRGGDVAVQISYTVTQACQAADESCEAIELGAQLTVTARSRSQTLILKGGCGT